MALLEGDRLEHELSCQGAQSKAHTLGHDHALPLSRLGCAVLLCPACSTVEPLDQELARLADVLHPRPKRVRDHAAIGRKLVDHDRQADADAPQHGQLFARVADHLAHDSHGAALPPARPLSGLGHSERAADSL